MKALKRLTLFFMAVFLVSTGTSLRDVNHFSVPVMAWSGTQVSDAGDYYEPIRGLKGTALKNGLNTLIMTGVDQDYAWARYEAADEMEGDSSQIMGVYSRLGYLKTNHVSGSTGWNREHAFPQNTMENAGLSGSTGTGNTSFNDNHHIFASDNRINSVRSNNKYGVVASHSSPVKDSYGNITDNYYSGGIFEPSDAAKGEVARATLYMVVAYPALEIADNFQAQDLCFDWHEDFPVSNREIRRNNVVYQNQHNRNPFIDHPEFAVMIWDSSYSGNGALEDGGGTIYPDPTGVTISGPSEVNVGSTITLTASVAPSGARQSVSWVSEDTSVATITNAGVLTGVKAGTVTIYATSTVNTSLYDSKAITVKQAVIPPDPDPVDGTITYTTGGNSTLLTPATLLTASTDDGDNLDSYSGLTRIYNGNPASQGGYTTALKNVLKFGSGSGGGTMTINFKTQVKDIVLTTSGWNNTVYNINVNGTTKAPATGTTPVTTSFSGVNSDVVTIASGGTDPRMMLYAVSYSLEQSSSTDYYFEHDGTDIFG
ncbi:MAG: endonuclease, partial [Erysipelotrichaceae bacterium]|nr:endonuclease [Erysipelotrichaceae bacterium]